MIGKGLGTVWVPFFRGVITVRESSMHGTYNIRHERLDVESSYCEYRNAGETIQLPQLVRYVGARPKGPP